MVEKRRVPVREEAELTPEEQALRDETEAPEAGDTVRDVEEPATNDSAETDADEFVEEQDPVAALEEENRQLKDKNLRLVAELANTRQRAERERSEALRYAEAEFAKELLIVLDDLERTRQSIDESSDAQSVAEGLRLVQDQFLKALASRKVAPIKAAGEPFDPDFHEAMMQQPSEEYPAGTVMQELQRGYKMHDRVIRPARVIVSSGSASE
jgi:molecular chaperone GrpE